MKSIILDSENVVVNVTVWSEDSSAPEGFTVDVVADDVIVGPGWKKDGNAYVPPPKPPEPPPTEAEFAAAIQAHIDAVARSKNYADGFALASYVNSTVPGWASEAQAFVVWRDQVWVYAYTELAKVQAGARPRPTIKDLIAELPAITWPA